MTETSTGLTTVDEVVGITSFSPERASAEQLLKWTRSYWYIENGLHYRRDVTLDEDGTRMSSSTLAETMADLNNFVVGLVSRFGFRKPGFCQTCV